MPLPKETDPNVIYLKGLRLKVERQKWQTQDLDGNMGPSQAVRFSDGNTHTISIPVETLKQIISWAEEGVQ